MIDRGSTKHTLSASLSIEEREVASELWQALMANGGITDARTRLIEAPMPIQQAVIHEIVSTLRAGQELHHRANPFEETL